jgi:hypothetical protein
VHLYIIVENIQTLHAYLFSRSLLHFLGFEVNPEKTKYMLMSRKKAGQKHSIKIKIARRKSLRADYIRGKLATIRSGVFCLPACCLGM